MFKLKYKEEDMSIKAIMLYLQYNFIPAGYYDENEDTIWIHWRILKLYPAYLIEVFLHEIIHWIVCICTKHCRHSKFPILLNKKNDDLSKTISIIMFWIFPKGEAMTVSKKKREKVRATAYKLSGHK